MMSYPLLWVIILILDVWAIISIIRSSAGLIVKLIWILLILVLPFIGLIIWFMVGPKRD